MPGKDGFEFKMGVDKKGEPPNKIQPSLFTSKDWKKPYLEFLKHLDSKGYGPIRYGEVQGYPLVKIQTPGKNRLVIISGVHGEEQIGPTTLVDNLDEILDYARRCGVALTIYPMLSPTGWGLGKRHTVEGKRTNRMVEFLVDGRWHGDVFAGKKYTQFRPAHDASPEAAALFRDAMANPVPKGMLDIHQDSDMKKKGKPSVTYAYVFEKKPYVDIAREAGKILPLATGTEVELYDVNQTHAKVDQDGFIIANVDCTTQGAFWALGCRNSVTIETSLEADYRKVHQINLVWIRGMIDLCRK